MSMGASRLVLGRQRPCHDTKPPKYYPRDLPTALSLMPALRELELHEVDCLGSAPGRELLADPRPVLSSLTSLSMSCETKSRAAATALYLWLRWALPAATQLRKLSVRGQGGAAEGTSHSPPCLHKAPTCSCSATACHHLVVVACKGLRVIMLLSSCMAMATCIAQGRSMHAGPDASSHPRSMVWCPPSLTELSLFGIPHFNEEAIIPCIRTLQLWWSKDHLDVPRLAAMTALQRACTLPQRTCSQQSVQLCLD